MELRLFPGRTDERWHNSAKRLTFQPPPPQRLRTSHELPFSPELLRAFRFGVGAEEQLDLERPARPTTTLVDAAASSKFPPLQERVKGYKGEREARCDTAFRCAQWSVLVVVLGFVVATVVVLSAVYVRVDSVLERMGGSGVQAKVDRVLDHALQAAMNTETATSNAAAVSALARTAATEAHPRLIDALNQTTDMMAELRDFSLHPQFTLSAGMQRRRERT